MLGIAIFQKAVIMLKIMPALSADDYTCLLCLLKWSLENLEKSTVSWTK